MDYNNREGSVYMDCKIRMSKRALSSVLYAVIMTNSEIVSTYGVGIYEYTREQNIYNMADIRIKILPSKINAFEALAETKLSKPPRITGS